MAQRMMILLLLMMCVSCKSTTLDPQRDTLLHQNQDADDKYKFKYIRFALIPKTKLYGIVMCVPLSHSEDNCINPFISSNKKYHIGFALTKISASPYPNVKNAWFGLLSGHQARTLPISTPQLMVINDEFLRKAIFDQSTFEDVLPPLLGAVVSRSKGNKKNHLLGNYQTVESVYFALNPVAYNSHSLEMITPLPKSTLSEHDRVIIGKEISVITNNSILVLGRDQIMRTAVHNETNKSEYQRSPMGEISALYDFFSDIQEKKSPLYTFNGFDLDFVLGL
ncbi:MAG: hypothetical protein OXC40_02810 [Proteobacteria bacterium]|nr:hypothetical protein [Pseudomonadota bacterium]